MFKKKMWTTKYDVNRVIEKLEEIKKYIKWIN